MTRMPEQTTVQRGAKRLGKWLLAITACSGLILTGCRKPHVQGSLAPQLRGPVKDLAAVRIEHEINLSWTVPRSGTRKLVENGLIRVRVCRREAATAACSEAGEPLLLARGATGSFSEMLPAALASGRPRLLYYSVELMDRGGRSTGISNSVVTLAGAPPPPVQGLMAELTPDGVLLRWQPDTAGNSEGETEVLLRRWDVPQTQSSEAIRENSNPFLSKPEKELIVEDGVDQALDPDIRRGNSYDYSAQRVFRITVAGQTLELYGQSVPLVRVNTASGLHN
jgi:hypothetical protein